MSKSKNPDPAVIFCTAKIPLSALAARWRMPAGQLEAALRRHAGQDWNLSISVELPAEACARALHAARRMLSEGDRYEF